MEMLTGVSIHGQYKLQWKQKTGCYGEGRARSSSLIANIME